MKLHHLSGIALHESTRLGLLEMTDVTGVTVVDLLFQLRAGENSLVAVDNDDMIAAVHMGSKGRLCFASENIGGNNGNASDRQTCRVDHIPLAVNLTCFGHKC